MRRWVKLAVVLALGCSLQSGCGPKSIYNSIFPQRYSVEQSYALRDGSLQHTQHARLNCSVSETPDSIGQPIIIRYHAENLWASRSDGSILVLPNLSPCRWNQVDLPGQAIDLSREANYDPAFLFPNTSDPKYVDLITLKQLRKGYDGLVLDSLKLTASTDPRTNGLPAAFPLRAAFPWYAPVMDPRNPPEVPATGSAQFVGPVAHLWHIGEAVCRNQPDGPDPQIINDEDCARSDGDWWWTSGSVPPNAGLLGMIDLHVSEDAATASGSLKAPLSRTVARLYRSDYIQSKPGVPWSKSLGWQPKICIDSSCSELGEKTTFYFRKLHLLVTVRMREQSFGRSVLSR
jgi:hypothetical protein